MSLQALIFGLVLRGPNIRLSKFLFLVWVCSLNRLDSKWAKMILVLFVKLPTLFILSMNLPVSFHQPDILLLNSGLVLSQRLTLDFLFHLLFLLDPDPLCETNPSRLQLYDRRVVLSLPLVSWYFLGLNGRIPVSNISAVPAELFINRINCLCWHLMSLEVGLNFSRLRQLVRGVLQLRPRPFHLVNGLDCLPRFDCFSTFTVFIIVHFFVNNSVGPDVFDTISLQRSNTSTLPQLVLVLSVLSCFVQDVLGSVDAGLEEVLVDSGVAVEAIIFSN